MRFATLVATLLSGALVSFSASAPAKPQNPSGEGEKLLKEIQASADQMRSPASKLIKLSSEPGAKWSDYDREWNALKPAQEQIDLAVQHLERIKSSLTPEEQKQFAKMQPQIATVNSAIHDLWIRIGQAKTDMKPAVLKADSQRLDKAVHALVTAVSARS